MGAVQDFKKKILHSLIAGLEEDMGILVRAAVEAREAATHPESKAENKYDTRGLEASYLAGAQAKRAAELQDLIEFLKRLEPLEFQKDAPIASTALVEVESSLGRQCCFIIPKGQGKTLKIGDTNIQVLTAQSPLGQDLLGRQAGEEFDLIVSGSKRTFEILSVS